MPDPRAGLFPALLKHWRGQRSLSQLDLGLAADVSARHISFLETGRSRPSVGMVLRLGTTLGVPLRQVDAMLRAAGHDTIYDTTPGELPQPVKEALELLKRHHDPYPLLVIDRLYRVRDMNNGAIRLFNRLLGPGLQLEGLNLAELTFDPAGAHPLVANFETVGRQLLWRLQREALADPNDSEIRALLDRLVAMPTVSPNWRTMDPEVPSDPVLILHLRTGEVDLRFMTMITAFQAPQNAAVEDLRIESWLPYDAATDALLQG